MPDEILRFQLGDRFEAQHPYVRSAHMAKGTVVLVQNNDWYAVLFDDVPLEHGLKQLRGHQMKRQRQPFDLTLPPDSEIDEMWRLARLRNKEHKVHRAFAMEMFNRLRKS